MREGKSHQSAAPESAMLPGAGTSGAADTQVLRLIHEFSQPLTAISNYAQAGSHLIDKGLADTARLRELFEKIVSQCTRTFVISRELNEVINRQESGSDEHVKDVG